MSTEAHDGTQRMRASLAQRRALLLIFVVFALLAFSWDILDAAMTPSVEEEPPPGLVVGIDAFLLAVVGKYGLRTREDGSGRRDYEAGIRFFVVGAVLMLALDVAWGAVATSGWGILLEIVWVAPLALLACYVLDVNPLNLPDELRRAENGTGAEAAPQAQAAGDRDDTRLAEARRARDKLVYVTPLLVGVAATYVAQRLYYSKLWNEVDRVAQVDSGYFSQMSEIIPVLLVALAIDASFLSAKASVSTTRWAISVYAVALLVAAEALAVSVLPMDETKSVDQLHQFIAFSITIYACFVALAALVVMNATGLGQRWEETEGKSSTESTGGAAAEVPTSAEPGV